MKIVERKTDSPMEVLFDSYLNRNGELWSNLDDRAEAMFDRITRKELFDEDTLSDFMLETRRAGFYAGAAAMLKMILR